jgi:hypothetical protein
MEKRRSTVAKKKSGTKGRVTASKLKDLSIKNVDKVKGGAKNQEQTHK